MQTGESIKKNPVKHRLSKEEKTCHVNAFRQSGKSMKAWCAENGLNYSVFKRWLYKDRHGNTSQAAVPAKATTDSNLTWMNMRIDTKPSPDEKTATEAGLLIEANGIRIHVRNEASQDLLKLVLNEVLAR